MSQLFGIRLENIKIFREQTDFTFAPITVLTGANSSGKSTLCSAIKLLTLFFSESVVDDNFVDGQRNRQLIFDRIFKKFSSNSLGDKIADFRNLLSFGSESDIMCISLPLDLPDFDERYMLTVKIKVSTNFDEAAEIVEIVIDNPDSENDWLLKAYGSISSGHKLRINPEQFYKNLEKRFAEIEPLSKVLDDYTDRLNKNGQTEEDDLKGANELVERLIGPGIEPIFFEDGWELIDSRSKISLDDILNDEDSFYPFIYLKDRIEKNTREFKFIRFYAGVWSSPFFESGPQSISKNVAKGKAIVQHNQKMLGLINEREFELSKSHGIGFYPTFFSLNDIISSICIGCTEQGKLFLHNYFGKLSLAIDTAVSRFRVYDFKLNQVALSEGRQIILNQNNIFRDDLVAYSRFSNTLCEEQEFLNRWTRKFNIGEKIQLERSEQVVRIKVVRGDCTINIADEGYGVSRLIPLLIKIVNIAIRHSSEIDDAFRESVIILIEEPEIGLHPALQSLLADMFFDAMDLFKIQFIIETHSEYLIRRLQVITADPISKCTPGHSQIYYFYHPEKIPVGEKQVFDINIEADGSLSRNFGRGFYDESSNLNIALYQASKINHN